jgi:hypothetical protein
MYNIVFIKFRKAGESVWRIFRKPRVKLGHKLSGPSGTPSRPLTMKLLAPISRRAPQRSANNATALKKDSGSLSVPLMTSVSGDQHCRATIGMFST